MNLIPISILIIGLLLAFKHKNYFIYFFIICTTKFFGFLDLENLSLINGINFFYPSFCIIFLIPVLKKIDLKSKNAKFLALFFFGFFLFGFLRPLLIYGSDIKSALVVSKEFFSIFFIIYLLNFKRSISTIKLINFLITVGLILSYILIIFKLFDISPPFYINGDSIRVYYPSYISLACFFTYYKILSSSKRIFKHTLYLVVLLVSLAITEYDSLIISVVVLLIFHFIFLRNSNKLFSFKTIFKTVPFIIVFVFFTLNSSYVNKLSIFFSTANPALSSRESYNKFRLDAIADSFYWGYGFLHKDLDKAQEYIDDNNNRFKNSFEVIDSGYIDLMIKFGIIGLCIYLFFILRLILKNLKKYNTNSFEFISTIFIIHLLLVNYTWSVFTYRHGLIPLFIVLLLLEKKIPSNRIIKT